MFPHFGGVGMFDSPRCPDPMRRSARRGGTHLKFRGRVLDQVASGRKVADVARDLDVSDQTITTGGTRISWTAASSPDCEAMSWPSSRRPGGGSHSLRRARHDEAGRRAAEGGGAPKKVGSASSPRWLRRGTDPGRLPRARGLRVPVLRVAVLPTIGS